MNSLVQLILIPILFAPRSIVSNVQTHELRVVHGDITTRFVFEEKEKNSILMIKHPTMGIRKQKLSQKNKDFLKKQFLSLSGPILKSKDCPRAQIIYSQSGKDQLGVCLEISSPTRSQLVKLANLMTAAFVSSSH